MLKKDLLKQIDAKVKRQRNSAKSTIKHIGLREFLLSWLSAAIADMDALRAKDSSSGRISYYLSTEGATLYNRVNTFDSSASVNIRTVVDEEADTEEAKMRSLRIDGVIVTLSNGEIISVDTADMLMRTLES